MHLDTPYRFPSLFLSSLFHVVKSPVFFLLFFFSDFSCSWFEYRSSLPSLSLFSSLVKMDGFRAEVECKAFGSLIKISRQPIETLTLDIHHGVKPPTYDNEWSQMKSHEFVRLCVCVCV